MTRLIYLDTETTGLSPLRGAEIWELALNDGDTTLEYQLPIDLALADPFSLRIGGFYGRRPKPEPNPDDLGGVCMWRGSQGSATLSHGWVSIAPSRVAALIAERLSGAHLVGANPSFDALFIEMWLSENGQVATWDHHLVDVEERVAALYGLPAGIGLRKSAELIGLDVDESKTHSALYDAKLARRVYEWCIAQAPFSVPEEDAA